MAESEATSHRSGTRGRRFEHLDMLRGAAALLVLVGHVRGFVFLDYGQLPGNRLLAAPLYFAGGLAHQAVVLFFALSGFLVGGRALREIRHGSWNLPDYAVHRLARLWTALIPALIATALLDWIGRDLLHLTGYAGEYIGMLSSGPEHGAPATSSIAALFGNILFLQGITVPVFGTDSPLWSLANEFWYYFLVPFGWLALAGRGVRPIARLAAGIFAVFACLWLPHNLVALGGIWICGAVAWSLADRIAGISVARFRIVFGAILAVLAAMSALSLARPGIVDDILLGIACAAALPCLARLANPGGLYGRVAFWISEISFTLYVVHFPLLALLWFALLAPHQFAVGAGGIAAASGLILAALGYTFLWWWLFERNTPAVRQALSKALRIAPK